MTEDREPEQAPPEPAHGTGHAGTEHAGTGGDGAGSSALERMGDEVAQLRELLEARWEADRQRERMYDELYRQLEFARKGLADEYLAPIARELLLVIDRLDTLAVAPGQGPDQGAAADELASVRAELAEVLRRRGVREVDASDEVFDPRVHEAVGRRNDPDRAGRVVEVRRPGYALGDRLVRPAQVVVGYAG